VLDGGLYRLSNAPHLTNPDWVAVAMRAPNAVVCLISALALHGMTTQVPHSIDLAIPSHGQIAKVDALPIRVFWYSEPAFSAGVELVRIDEVSIRIYSAAKTVVDCFKYRNKIGLDIAVEALRRFRELKKKADFRIGIGAAVTRRPLPHHRAYGSVHGGSRRLRCTHRPKSEVRGI